MQMMRDAVVRLFFLMPILVSASVVSAEASPPESEPDNTITTKAPFTIHWAVNPAPPFHIVEGPYQNQGMCDVLVESLQAVMTEENHDVVEMPQSRIRYLIEQQENLCFPCMIKRDVSDLYYYTDLTVVHPPLGLIMRRDTYLKMSDDGADRVSLSMMVANKALRFGRPVARRYPDPLQDILERNKGTANMFSLSGAKATVRVLEQIELGRLDYTLEYPTILRYYRLTHARDSLIFLPTEEVGNMPVPGAIGCTKNSWGKQAVERINRALETVTADDRYQASQAFWQRINEIDHE